MPRVALLYGMLDLGVDRCPRTPRVVLTKHRFVCVPVGQDRGREEVSRRSPGLALEVSYRDKELEQRACPGLLGAAESSDDVVTTRAVTFAKNLGAGTSFLEKSSKIALKVNNFSSFPKCTSPAKY